LERAQLQQKQDGESHQDLEERKKRDDLREERRRDREREHRLENFAGKNKSKFARDLERDVSEKIALGQAVGPSHEALYDQRLFNQSSGIDQGFGDEEGYNVYSEPLFRRDDHNAIFKAPKRDDDVYGGSANMDELLNTSRFKPDKDFEGIDKSKAEPRSGPVQFEKDKEPDPFGLDKFLHEAKTGKKSTRPTLGVMHATGGGSGAVDDYRGDRGSTRKRDRLEFESKGTTEQKEEVRENERERQKDRDRHKERNKEREDRAKEPERSRETDRARDRKERRDHSSPRSRRHKRRSSRDRRET